MKNYTTKQIENAKISYNESLTVRTVESYDPELIGWSAAEQRCDFNNRIVFQIQAGNKEVIRKWKLFFLDEEFKADQKLAESKAKLSANKTASEDILSAIKAAKRIVEFGKWLNTPGNVFRKQHFSKKYTIESVNSFLSI